jgi:iron complex transport system substrate-binding protein
VLGTLPLGFARGLREFFFSDPTGRVGLNEFVLNRDAVQVAISTLSAECALKPASQAHGQQRSIENLRMKGFLLFGLSWLISSSLWAYAVHDDRRHVLEFQAPPQRIVSLLPSLSEMVCALKACERLVGVDRYSKFPKALKNVYSVGSGLDPNVEAIVALKPDVVLMSQAPRAIERLESLGLKVMVLEAKNLADVDRIILALGVLLGSEEAKPLLSSLHHDLQVLAASVSPKIRGARVYFEVNRGPYAASESSFVGEILQKLGAQNIVPGHWGPFPLINPEFVVKASPDLILISANEATNLASRPGWSTIGAIKTQRICALSKEQDDVLARPGPRMAQGAQILAHCLSSLGGLE